MNDFFICVLQALAHGFEHSHLVTVQLDVLTSDSTWSPPVQSKSLQFYLFLTITLLLRLSHKRLAVRGKERNRDMQWQDLSLPSIDE